MRLTNRSKKMSLFFQQFLLLFATILLLSPQLTFAYSTSDSYQSTEIGYDTIISELSKNKRKFQPKRTSDPFSLVKIHTGVGIAQSLIQVRDDSGRNIQGFHRGIQATLGIDLFSRNWFAESAIRSFGQTALEDNFNVQLREFDLKVIYRSNPYRLFGYRAGIGLSARNLKIISSAGEQNFSTPASILLFGIDANVSKTISIGSEASYRTAIIDESNDRSSFDVSLKLGAHF